jgi:hypothetical protein
MTAAKNSAVRGFCDSSVTVDYSLSWFATLRVAEIGAGNKTGDGETLKRSAVALGVENEQPSLSFFQTSLSGRVRIFRILCVG